MKNSANHRSLNFVANILLVLIGTILVGTFAYRIFYQPSIGSLGSLEANLLKAGEKFKGLQEINFEKSPNTILLVTDIKCPYCTQSLPFYKKLISKSKENSSFRIIAVFTNEKEEVARYLREHEFDVEFIPDIDLVKLKADATPTMIWVDANREIIGSYQGMLKEEQETAFFKAYENRLVRR